MKRKILITGATGLVGSHILMHVLQKGNTKVYALKRKNSDLKPLNRLFEWHNSTDLLNQVNWINYDLSQHELPNELPQSLDEIIHTAAVVSFNPEDYEIMRQINVEATENLLAYAQKSGVSKFGFISSIAALGRINASGKYTEDAEWSENESNSFYSKTKYESERLVISEESFDTYIVNPGVILGPCDWNKSSGTIFRTGAKGIAFYSKGQNGFVDVRDVSKGILEIMETGAPRERHILVGENVSYKQVFSQLCTEFGNKPPFIYSPPWLTGLGWRLDKVRSKLKGVAPTLTKETAQNANGIYTYDNSKMISKGFKFTPISQTIKESVPFFKQYYF